MINLFVGTHVPQRTLISCILKLTRTQLEGKLMTTHAGTQRQRHKTAAMKIAGIKHLLKQATWIKHF